MTTTIEAPRRARDTRHRRYGLLAASFGAVLVVSVAGILLTSLGLGPWYDALPKPAWTPPEAAFGPVWTTLYVLQAIAAWLVARAGWRTPGVRAGLGLYGLQLALQVAWSGTFFALRAPGAAVAVILALLVTLGLTTAAFARVRPLAAALLAPAVAWVAFAAALNVAIALRA
ncbi:MAG: tryptophan-rich sensory protein [Planctomycetes bacterium]|nr:tryptophan-rich sensory protein [Planctomycetota bacterium]